jgi:SAM-dependent methyltransferase
MDRALEQFGRGALISAQPRKGERVVDVGCGCGATTLALAQAVGPTGSVLGVDVSAPMLARARQRAREVAWITLVEADAATYAFEPRADLLFSRFGVMFFADPTAAFSNLRRALTPHGRLAFICWRALADNPWLALPLAAAKRVVSLQGPPPPTDAPGPLSFADPQRVRTILGGAGFAEIAVDRFDHPMPLGDGKGLDAAVEHALTLGPTARLLASANADDSTLAQVRREVRDALEPYASSNALNLPAGAWIVTAIVKA